MDISRDEAARGRWAVAAIFFANGFLIGSWAPQIPELLARLAITEFTLGLLILLFGAGALVAMPACGVFIGRYGSRAVLRVVAPAGAFGLLAVAAAPSVPAAAFALPIFGAVIGGMDVAMNANAVAVERRLGRAVMSSSHGFWSLGGFAGGGLGGIAIQQWGYMAHAALVTIVALAVVAIAVRPLVVEFRAPAPARRARIALPRGFPIYLTGLVALMSMVPEGAVLDWAALYLRQELGAGIASAGFAFAAFSAAMALMRFAGDSVRGRFGAVATLRLSSLVAAGGMLAAGLSPAPWVAIVAFGICGLGIANMVPIAFSAAGNQPGISPGAGMSVATTIGYSGLLLAPSAVGFVAETTGFALVFVALSAMLLAVCAMAGLARPADAMAAPVDQPAA